MAFMNKVMMFLLRSPLHALFSRALVLVSYTGRRTGRSVSLPVQYALAGDTIWVLVGRPDTKSWWKNFVGAAPARLRLRGEWVDETGTAVLGATEPERASAALAAYRERFPKAVRALGLAAEGSPTAEEMAAAAARAVLVCFEAAAG